MSRTIHGILMKLVVAALIGGGDAGAAETMTPLECCEHPQRSTEKPLRGLRQRR